MSLLLAGLVAAGVGGAGLVGRWLARRREVAEAVEPAASPIHVASVEPASGLEQHLEGFPCQLGDVIVRATGEEAWLAGGHVFSETEPVAALFVAPEAEHDCVIFVRPVPQEVLYWLEPFDSAALFDGASLPLSVEHGGIRFERVRRLPLRAKLVGVGAAPIGENIVLTEYASTGSDRFVVVRGRGSPRAFYGVELGAESYEVIASGRSTLER